MQTQTDGHIQNILKISELLLHMANMGEKQCRDDGCLLLYGVVRDHAYGIRKMAENEKHIARREKARREGRFVYVT